MSTTINNTAAGVPDLDNLRQIANDLFQTLPNGFPKEISLDPQAHPKANHFADTLYGGLTIPQQPGIGFGVPPPSFQQADGFNVAKPQTSLPDPHFAENQTVPAPFPGIDFIPGFPGVGTPFNFANPAAAFPNPHSSDTLRTPPSFSGAGISPSTTHFENPVGLAEPHSSNLPYSQSEGFQGLPKSVAGSGISPSALQSGQPFNIGQPETRLPDSNYAGKGVVPQSVAGGGKSPSAINHGNEVDLANPQSSLQDPHFAGGGKIPASVAGSGKSPSLIQQDASNEQLPYSGSSFDEELQEALAGISAFQAVPQLPGFTTGFGDPSYYFLTGNKPLPAANSGFGSPLYVGKETHGGSAGLSRPPFDVNLIKKDFPILQEKVNGKPLIWLDNAATTQKPKQVIDRISYFYEHENSNIHRAAHELAARATDAYEGARGKIQRFINAKSPNEIVFVRGTTEAINLVAKSWGEQFLNPGDEIIVSHLEHHANIVPWQQLCAKKGLKLRVIPVDDDGQILLDEYAKLLNGKTKLVSFTQVSNALGTITPAKAIIEMAHAAGAKVLLDGAQSVSHLRADVQALNCDWFVFSGHKVFGPTGIGVLYGKEALLNETEPWQGGGNMIQDVTFEHTQYHNAPNRFEAGTGNIADAVGLGAAIDYVSKIGIDLINQYEHGLLHYATGLMQQVPGLRLIGTAAEKASVLSFTLKGYTNNEVGQELNKEGIAVRTGHHCAQPILRRFGLESTVRPSLAFYNTCADVDTLVAVLHKLKSGRAR